MKRIVYIHQYFKTPADGGSLRSYHISKAMIEDGYEVILITSHNNKNYQTKNIEGIQVHYLPVFYDNSMVFYSRINAFLSFVLKSISLTFKLKPDLIYATSTPLTIGIIPLLLKYCKQTPYIFEVRDLWPKAPIEMEYLKNPILQKLSLGLEKLIYKKSKGIVALSPGMQAHIQKIVPKKNIVYIPNMSDIEYFNFQPKNLENHPGQITISYIGSAGPANELQNLMIFSKYLNENNLHSIFIKIASKGKELESLKEDSEKYNLRNIEFLGYQNTKGIRELLSKSDFTYLSFRDIPTLRMASPNKLFDSLAAGVPVISAINGWWAQDLVQFQSGFVYDPAKPSELYDVLVPFLTNQTLLNQYKQNAYYLAKAKFSKEVQINKLLRFFAETISL